MEKIFEQIPESTIVTETIEKEIWDFIKRVSEIISKKKSEKIEIELKENEVKIMTWKFREKIEKAFRNKWWSIDIKTKTKSAWPQWDMYEVKYKKMIISVIN